MDRIGPHRPWKSRPLSAMVLSVLFVGLSGATAQADFPANFSVFCGPSHRNRSDPIVHPRHPGMAHLHQFFGNRSTNAFSTAKSMRRHGTTCRFPPDKAGYWIPALRNRNGKVVQPERLSSYYWGGRRTRAFPPGLKMIAGGNTQALRRAGWACGEGTGDFSRPPDCGNRRVKAVVIFPSCWDGKRKDSNNHRAHMSYPEAGRCPGHHPIQVPRLVFHVTYPVKDARGFRLSSDKRGDPGGTTLHGDFWNTWRQRALRRAVQQCLHGLKKCFLPSS